LSCIERLQQHFVAQVKAAQSLLLSADISTVDNRAINATGPERFAQTFELNPAAAFLLETKNNLYSLYRAIK
jgi:hypothetical protein